MWVYFPMSNAILYQLATNDKRNSSGQEQYTLSIRAHNYTAHAFKKMRQKMETSSDACKFVQLQVTLQC
jgi:hypothetical protein